jgi:hypothetical protein
MWIAKGVAVGVPVFVLLSVVYVVARIMMGTARSTGSTALSGWTIQNPLYWAAFLVVLVVSCALFWKWR